MAFKIENIFYRNFKNIMSDFISKSLSFQIKLAY